jgi:colanic acid/amylovoran biosynthesis glycosyltransferase
MQIAYLTNQYPKVSHTFIRREILALEARGLQVVRFSIRPSPDVLRDPEDLAEVEKTAVLIQQGWRTLLRDVVSVAGRRPLRFGKALGLAWQLGAASDRGRAVNLAYLVWAASLLKRAREQGCDHVHVHFGTNPASVALLCKVLGGPSYSFTVHGPEEFDKPSSISLREKIQGSEFVAAVSSFGRSQLYRHCGYDQWAKIRVVRCGVDDAFLAPPPVRPADSRKVLVCVGRICEQKGQLLLIEAVAALKRRGTQVSVVLVGDGELRKDAERRIEDLGVQELVTITGWASSEQVREHLLSARALVLPSFAEGLPVVIMEALALERPVLSTYVAGIPELVEDGVSGWLVPAGSVEALTDALERVHNTPESELQRLGAEGRRRVLAQHAIGDAVSPLVEAFTKRGG